MDTGNQIRYLRRQQIDISKWDMCVKQSSNGWLYARSFFLDGLGRWGALVKGDYDYIMPLPQKKKYGLPYVYSPPIIGQLGIISSQPVTTALTDAFIARVHRLFYVADIRLNEQNPGESRRLSGLTSATRPNYILPLQETYPVLYDRFSADGKKNIRTTHRLGLVPDYDIPISTVIRLYRDAYGKKNLNYSEKDYQTIDRIATLCITKGQGFTLGIHDPEKNLHAAGFFGIDEKRVYYLLGAPTPEGRKSNAVHRLVDEVIKKYAGTGLVFDFEGSYIPSVAAFYRKFAPMTSQYDEILIHRLPRWIRRFS
jgi:hypothetical protein